MKQESRKLIQNIIYLLMGLQIVLGAWWIGANMGELSRFEESMELLTMSETLRIDEYTGILYPLCLHVLFGLGGWIGLPGCALVYGLQLVTAWFSYGYFLKKVVHCNRKRVWFYVAYIMTLPPIAQCHVAILPYSPVSSVFIVLLADLMVMWCKEQELTGKNVLRIGILWVVSALLCPDYGWLSGIAVFISVLYCFLKNRRVVWQLLVVILAVVLSIGTIEALVQKEGAMGKIQKSVGSVLVQRFVWPNFATFQYFWSDEVLAIWDSRELAGLAMYPEQVIYEFGPILEQTYGRERAEEIYLEMARSAIGLDTKNIVVHMAEDMAAYVCPPLTMLLQLQGVGTSYTGWNYGRMKDYAPGVAGYYVEYALNAWVAIIGLSLLSFVLGKSLCRQQVKDTEDGTAQQQKKVGVQIGSFLCVVSVVINLWYTMCSGNMQDYKKLIVNSVLCTCLVIKLIVVSDIDRNDV